MPTIRPAEFPADAPIVQALFREYVDSLGVDLAFQDFEAELAGLPGKYAPPAGRLLLAFEAIPQPAGPDGRRPAPQALGCVALRDLGDGLCEMKRLYLRPAARGMQLGRLLAQRICDEAQQAGYRAIRLDTLPTMAAAQGLYQQLGFYDIDPYVFNPIAGTRYLQRDLSPAGR